MSCPPRRQPTVFDERRLAVPRRTDRTPQVRDERPRLRVDFFLVEQAQARGLGRPRPPPRMGRQRQVHVLPPLAAVPEQASGIKILP